MYVKCNSLKPLPITLTSDCEKQNSVKMLRLRDIIVEISSLRRCTLKKKGLSKRVKTTQKRRLPGLGSAASEKNHQNGPSREKSKSSKNAGKISSDQLSVLQYIAVCLIF